MRQAPVEKYIIVSKIKKDYAKDGKEKSLLGHGVAWEEKNDIFFQNFVYVQADGGYGIFSEQEKKVLHFEAVRTTLTDASKKARELTVEFAKDLSSRLKKPILYDCR